MFLDYLDSMNRKGERYLINALSSMEIVDYYIYQLRRGNYKMPEPKMKTVVTNGKKREVYTLPTDHLALCGVMAKELGKIKHLSSMSTIAYKPGICMGVEVRKIVKSRNKNMKILKSDFTNFFNSIDTIKLKKDLLPKLDSAILSNYIKEYCVYSGKGVYPGLPMSSVLCNIYLKEFDEFLSKRELYVRYSDDFLVSYEDGEDILDICNKKLKDYSVELKESKTETFKEGELIKFLGFDLDIKNEEVNMSRVNIRRHKKIIRDIVKNIHKKHYRERPSHKCQRAINKINGVRYGELSWSSQFFPGLTNDKDLKEIDDYSLENLRWLVDGSYAKTNCKIASYDRLKALGYLPTVKAYWDYRKHKPKIQLY